MTDRKPLTRREVPLVALSVVLAVLLIASYSISYEESGQITNLNKQVNTQNSQIENLTVQLKVLQGMLSSSNVTNGQLQTQINSIQQELIIDQFTLKQTQNAFKNATNYNSTVFLGGSTSTAGTPFYSTSSVSNNYAGYLKVNVTTTSPNSTIDISWTVHGYSYSFNETVGYHAIVYALALPSSALQFTIGPAITNSYNATLYY